MLLDDLGDYLSSQGVSNIFKARMPTSPDAVVTLYETGGVEPTHAFNSAPGRAVMEHARIQVVTRNGAYPGARTQAHTVYKLLDGLPERSINSVRYFYISAVQPPFAMPDDENGRARVACNYDVLKALSP